MTYDDFIQNIINTRGQWNIPAGEYYEAHHIIPKCLGGLPKKCHKNTHYDNIIWLTPQEHYEAHRLLVEKYPNDHNLLAAWWRCCHIKNIKISADEYTAAKLAHSRFVKEILGNKTRPQEVKDKIKATKQANQYVYSAEVKEKMRQAKLGKKVPIAQVQKMLKTREEKNIGRRAVLCIELNRQFNSVADANSFCEQKRTINNIHQCCYGKLKTAFGYHWAYINDTERINSLVQFIGKPRQSKKLVYCVELDKIFSSALEAMRQLGVKCNTGITSCCLGKAKTAYGYHWKYIEITEF